MTDTTITEETLNTVLDQVHEVLAQTAAAIELGDNDAVQAIFHAVAETARAEPDGAIIFTLGLLEQAGHNLVDLVAAESRIETELDTGTDFV